MTQHRTSPAAKIILALEVIVLASLAAGCYFTPQRSTAQLAPETDDHHSVPTRTAPAPASTAPLAQSLQDWQLYRDERYNFELLYPPGGSVLGVSANQARIDLPIRPGTNLHEKYLLVDVQQSEAGCQSPLAVGYSPEALQVSEVEIGELAFHLLSGSEGAAGNFYDWSGYSTAHQDLCVSLTFVLHSTDAYNFETPLAEFDRVSESEDIDRILASFRWQD